MSSQENPEPIERDPEDYNLDGILSERQDSESHTVSEEEKEEEEKWPEGLMSKENQVVLLDEQVWTKKDKIWREFILCSSLIFIKGDPVPFCKKDMMGSMSSV